MKIFLSLSLLTLQGCFLLTPDLKWTEDVRLPDGRIIRLTRYVELGGPAGKIGESGTESSQWFEFKHPVTGKTIRWENKMEPGGRLDTIAIWITNDVPMLLAVPSYGDDSAKFGCPNPPYLLYEYVNGSWISKPLDQVPLQRVRSNMTRTPASHGDEIVKRGRHLSVDQTSDTYTHVNNKGNVPYVIKFSGMQKQTFVKYANCDKPTDRLIDLTEK